MPPKERRKGKKEIHKDNTDTLVFYWKFITIGTGVQMFHTLLSYFIASEFSKYNYFFLLLAIGVQYGCYTGLQKMATPKLGPRGELLEAGMDLSETYFSEYAIDFIILTTGIQVLSAVSNYMWLLWLLGPSYLLYKIWTSVIWPWFMSGAPDGGDMDNEKQRKKQRQKIRRVH